MSCKKVAIYIRVANKDTSSINVQKECLTTYCLDKKFEDYEFYIDNGYSSNNLQRPALQKLIQDAIDKKISHCIVYQLDRLSRSTKDTLHIINDLFIPHEVNLVSIIDGLDTSTSLGKYIINMYSMIAASKRGEKICQKTKR